MKAGLCLHKWHNCDRYSYHIVSVHSETWQIGQLKYSPAPIEGNRESLGSCALSSVVSEISDSIWTERQTTWINFHVSWTFSSTRSFLSVTESKGLIIESTVLPPQSAGEVAESLHLLSQVFKPYQTQDPCTKSYFSGADSM